MNFTIDQWNHGYKKNDIEMYSTHHEGKSEKFIMTLKSKIYNCMISVSNNGYIDKLDDTVNKKNNTYHRTIKMKPIRIIEQLKWNPLM